MYDGCWTHLLGKPQRLSVCKSPPAGVQQTWPSNYNDLKTYEFERLTWFPPHFFNCWYFWYTYKIRNIKSWKGEISPTPLEIFWSSVGGMDTRKVENGWNNDCQALVRPGHTLRAVELRVISGWGWKRSRAWKSRIRLIRDFVSSVAENLGLIPNFWWEVCI